MATLTTMLSADHSDHVISLHGIGGSGKSALLAELLAEDALAEFENIFVWSFEYDDDLDRFLSECTLYMGHEPIGVSFSLAYQLMDILQTATPTLILLDGFERFQDPKTGVIRDHILRLIVARVSSKCGHTKLLLASQLPVVAPGIGCVLLDSLDPDAAVKLLQARGVRAPLEQLSTLAESYGRHALCLSLAGQVLAEFHSGSLDVDSMPDLRRFSSLPAVSHLTKILNEYAERMEPRALAAVRCLSLLRKGVSRGLFLDLCKQLGS
jgi:hypothetical protein